MNRLLVSSDPYITSLRKLPLRKKKKLNPEVLSLLEEPEVFKNSKNEEEVSKNEQEGNKNEEQESDLETESESEIESDD